MIDSKDEVFDWPRDIRIHRFAFAKDRAEGDKLVAMSAKASWTRRLRRLQELSAETTAGEVAVMLEISNRRAQQLLQHVEGRIVGNTRLMRRDDVVRALRGIRELPVNDFELDRLASLRAKVAQWNEEISGPDRLMVAAPVSVVNTSLDGLPDGVSVEPGRITLDVNDAEDAARKLLTLAFAIKNSISSFELAVKKP